MGCQLLFLCSHLSAGEVSLPDVSRCLGALAERHLWGVLCHFGECQLISAKQSTQSTVRLTFLGMLQSNYSSFAISSSADLFWRLLKSDEFMLSPWSVAAGMQTAFITNQRISSLRGVDELQEEFKRRFCWSAFSSLKVCSIKHRSQGF